MRLSRFLNGYGACWRRDLLRPSTRARENDRIGGTAKFENVLKFQPDLIIDIGSVGPSYVSLDKQCAGFNEDAGDVPAPGRIAGAKARGGTVAM